MTKILPTRWFRFSLRTLFVAVTVFAVWLGWEWNWIRQRRAAVARTESPEIAVVLTEDDDSLYSIPRPKPFVLWLFRQPTYARVLVRFEQRTGGVLDAEQMQELRTLVALFPEAEVTLAGQIGMTVRPDPLTARDPFADPPNAAASDDPFNPPH